MLNLASAWIISVWIVAVWRLGAMLVLGSARKGGFGGFAGVQPNCRSNGGLPVFVLPEFPDNPCTTSPHSVSDTCCSSETCGLSFVYDGSESEKILGRCPHFCIGLRRDRPRCPSPERMQLAVRPPCCGSLRPSSQPKANGRREPPASPLTRKVDNSYHSVPT